MLSPTVASGVFPPRRLASERGSEPVSFALVAPLVLFVVLGVLQLSLVLWVKTTLIDAAGAGAHAAAATSARPGAAEETVREVLSSTIGRNYVKTVQVARVPLATVSNQFGSAPVDAVQVTLEAPLPVLGIFEVGSLRVVGHAMLEVAP